ncbi:hypothetical protein DO97_16440 [Neosynechococcus sphagnicola sy1]|uniref:Uncharacterized protein n=1 Tax=Neosynechococcus sphagnicola sy1 TaxID=1497020 RepID=A0A098TI25_9CYAN|nr:hypothetical protein [Neosynechococcus sphagnicola]KGF71671.1 hypothetical protein DO97_16440 [Neosynechococcus sphagnicola sy1]
MRSQLATIPEIAILTSPTHPPIQTAAEWLAEQSHPNPNLEIALNLVLQGRVISQEPGERLAIAVEQTQCTRPTRVCLWAFEVMCGG